MAEAEYALAQHGLPRRRPRRPRTPSCGSRSSTASTWFGGRGGCWKSFLTDYPDDPAADQAAFSAATALLDLRAYTTPRPPAIATPFAIRRAICWTVSGTWPAIAGLPPASTRRPWRCAARWPRPRGSTRDGSPRAQPQQVAGRSTFSARSITAWARPPTPIREYRRVEDQFVDAKQSIAYFLRKAIELPEVITLKPGEPAEVELKFRNVAACDLKVYRIDLMKFSLLKRSLGGITQINLAGIRPHHQEAIALGDGRDYRDRTRKLTLPLEGRRGLSGRLPRRQSLCQRPGAGHSAGGRGAGRRRLGAGPHHRQEPHRRQVPARRPRQGDRQRQRGFRLRPDRPAGPVRGRRHPRRGDGDCPGRPLALCVLPREGNRVAVARSRRGRRPTRLRSSRARFGQPGAPMQRPARRSKPN